MALNGTLEELAVLDVVQFVNQAHLSGKLVLKTQSEEAELFYRKGGLVDARLGEVTGLDVLVRIVDWTGGNFSFHPGVESPGETIRMDLHRAVMYALKTRDEREQENKKRKAEEVRKKAVSLKDQLAELIAPLEFVEGAAIFDESGVLAVAGRNGASGDDLVPLANALIAFNSGYVRGRFRRGILDDEKGTVLVSSLQRNRWVVITAARGTALGAATVGMGRLVAKVDALGAETEVLAGAV
jgi:predicted regulator of Ras-like GTPase activity (Roadblock/LC7/MglB family)